MLPCVQSRWHSVPPAALSWRDWGGDVVVFNQATGSTHLLGQFAAEILLRLCLRSDGTTINALAERLADDSGLDADDRLIEAIADALSDFVRLGLARRVEV